ncbi:MAG: MBOAT family protein [Acidimicrobiia bacterium]|nr:MBOAT family protein [Acidimicrobiia bacterium]
MVFADIPFVFYFLPITLALYFGAFALTKYGIKKDSLKARNGALLLASLVFYIWGGGWFILILMVSITIDFVFGWMIDDAHQQGNKRRAKTAMLASAVLNLSLLFFFKYANFVTGEVSALSDKLGFGATPVTDFILPIGISFFTLQSLSYSIDVYRGRCRHLTNFFDFTLFVVLFPQLIAGPIVRFHELADQLYHRQESVEMFAQGALRFSHGLAKKVIVADSIARISDAVYDLPGGELNFVTAWLGVLAFAFQLYFDFSGYSDMAIGLGLMFGFRFPENFNRPYSAISLTDFWRRWHITLSNFIRDYLYIPLGGNRVGPVRKQVNLIIIFLAIGIWHGANWTFFWFGLYHGVLIVIENITGQDKVTTEGVSWVWPRRIGTFLLILICYPMFNGHTMSQAIDFYQAMFWPSGTALPAAVEDAMTNLNTLMLFGATLTIFLPRDFRMGIILEKAQGMWPTAARVAVMGGALPYAAAVMAAGSFSPFLYFQF